MKKMINRYLYLLVFISASHTYSWSITPQEGVVLTGKITAKSSGEHVPFASIYFPVLKKGTVTSLNGLYKLENLPRKKLLVQISLVGYKSISTYVNLQQDTTIDFVLEESITEINEIVVTGQSNATEKKKTPTPISTLSSTQLLENNSTNIIDALSKQPGIAQLTTGSGISKPVIRGLGFNRVVVIHDGVKQEGQQWGDEHGIEVDEFSVNKVEILKGPASLAYGSDAISGVINLLSTPTLPEGVIRGKLLINYQSNNGLFACSVNASGNQNGLVWDIRGSSKNAHAYQNKFDGYVYNSGFDEKSISGSLGINKVWGFCHLNLSYFSLSPGMIEGERDSSTGQFTKPVFVNDTTTYDEIVSKSDLKEYNIDIPKQQVNHLKVVLTNNIVTNKGTFNNVLGFQQNSRKEYDNIAEPDNPGLSLLLNTLNYDFRYNFPEKNNYSITTGMNGMLQNNLNKGDEYLIPDYNLTDCGAFVTGRKSFGKADLSGGFRFDLRNQLTEELFLDTEGNPVEAESVNSIKKFDSFSKLFTGFSGGIGISYEVSSSVYGKLNLAKGYRAPNIAELTSNGEHEGTFRYEIGNNKLKPESNWQIDFAFGVNTDHITLELDLFSNHIDHFIFSEKISGASGSDSTIDGLSVFQYTSGNALLKGGEFVLDIHPHPLDWLHFQNTISLVNATQKSQPDSTRYLPRIPAPKISTEIHAEFDKQWLICKKSYLKVEMENYLKQDKIYEAYQTETATPGYTLVHIGFGTSIMRGSNTLFSLYASLNNITNVAYQNHLSRLKYAPENFATGRTGIYNMGRNFSIKLLFPFDLKKN